MYRKAFLWVYVAIALLTIPGGSIAQEARPGYHRYANDAANVMFEVPNAWRMTTRSEGTFGMPADESLVMALVPVVSHEDATKKSGIGALIENKRVTSPRKDVAQNGLTGGVASGEGTRNGSKVEFLFFTAQDSSGRGLIASAIGGVGKIALHGNEIAVILRSVRPITTTAPPVAAAPSTTGAALATSSAAMPTKIDICLKGAVISALKADGTPWHPPGAPPTPDQLKTINSAFDSIAKLSGTMGHPEGAVAALVAEALAPPLLQALEKPHVYGTMKLARSGIIPASDDGPDVMTIASRDKPFKGWQPEFGDRCFRSVFWNDQLKILVSLKDKHWLEKNDENIADVYVNADAIRSVYVANERRYVPTARQSKNLLFVSLAVTTGN